MALSRRRLARAAATLAAVLAILAPAVLVFGLGWIEIAYTPWGEPPRPDPTPIEYWVLLALFYLLWAPLVAVVLVVVLDRLGYRYTPVDRERRPTAKEGRRLRAGLSYLQARQAPPSGVVPARGGKTGSAKRAVASSRGGNATPRRTATAADDHATTQPREGGR